MKKLTSAAVAAATAGALMLGTGSASAASTASPATPAASSSSATPYAASQAFGVAAKDTQRSDLVQPTAIPAIVGTAFVAGAAYGAGKVVAGWAAKKVIGRWDVPTSLHASMLD